MIEGNLSLIGQKGKNFIAKNSVALGHETHNRVTDKDVCNGILFYEILSELSSLDDSKTIFST